MKYHSISSSLISDILLFGFVYSHKGPAKLPQCGEMLMPKSGNVMKCNKIKMPKKWNETNCYKMSWNIDVLFMKYYGMQKMKQRNKTN